MFGPTLTTRQGSRRHGGVMLHSTRSSNLQFAQCWAAGAIQEMMDDVERENCKRGDSLNLSLRFAIAGAAFMAAAALSRIVFV